ncbi:DEAD/DEAH box helicase [Mariniblastus sp.]|nr:DEAD/DEAH box helicase [Mariniblastus sp.]
MIQRSKHFDLGRDKTRMKDSADADRQSETVDALLNRFFNEKAEDRWEIQILADEVGMGKTFVALGTAYSVLQAMKEKTASASLRKCYKKILIVTPHNSALFKKWNREVGEFVKRCVHSEHQKIANKWFRSKPIERIDELALELRQGGSSPKIIITSMSVFAGGRLQNYDVKKRQLLGSLFRNWGNRFNHEKRKRLLRGAPAGWPSRAEELSKFTEREWNNQLLFDNEEVLDAVKELDSKPDSNIEALLELCDEIATPFVRDRDELFSKVENRLIKIYREMMTVIVNRSLPLVIVDEAHNWKNGPRRNSNGYQDFMDLIGCRTRRALLLTATPFQLRPSEMLEILKVADHLKPEPTIAESKQRTELLTSHRENVVRPVLDRSSRASQRFARAWSKLPAQITTELLRECWNTPPLVAARQALDKEAEKSGVVDQSKLERIIGEATCELDPDIRQLIREALRLFVYNSDLSYELGRIVVRHRRRAEHRHFRVGYEFAADVEKSASRLDKHLLHSAPGVDVKGEGELPHYLLMRCVSESKGGKGKSSLGSALTGCYSTLLHSAEGKKVSKRLGASSLGRVYLDLLMDMVSEEHDHKHPKVREVVDSAIENWKAGEKTLVFCFRTNNAKRLKEIIDERIKVEMNSRQEKCLGSGDSLRVLRSRMTGRDRDLIVLGLDRVLWSLLWLDELREQIQPPLTPDDLELSDNELRELAALSLNTGVDIGGERVDRVFLNRATEHIVAGRLLATRKCSGKAKKLLQQMQDIDWLVAPYGIDQSGSDDDEEHAHFDERGVHSRYEDELETTDREIDQLAETLVERRLRARKNSIFDVYGKGPSLWLGESPHEEFRNRKSTSTGKTLTLLHGHLLGLTISENEIDWHSRLLLFQGLRRAVFRDSVLLRLLPDKKELDEGSWGELLVKSFNSPLPQQSESMLDRVTVFVEDLLSASGSLTEVGSARHEFYNATKLRGSQAVAVVSGETKSDTRTRIFSGFNSPLEPEILICTSVGQEGIDLHRHCRHVVHFDLAWNPAVLEQRTGRTDRIGSKTFRERELATNGEKPHLEIGVPYLAGTYDERMYEELRLRAQTFEVLTGGDLAADAEGSDDHKDSEGVDGGLPFVPLPDEMISSMRVNLHVWERDANK